MPKLKRELKGGESGTDVTMVQRALNRWATPTVAIPVTGKYDHKTRDRMLSFEAAERGGHVDGLLGQETFDILWRWFDPYGRMRYLGFRLPPVLTEADKAFAKLLDAMRELAERTPGYVFGGQHGIPLSRFDPSKGSDCSSSCSEVLYVAGLFHNPPRDVAYVSGQFEHWGAYGKGKYFTVWANSEHVWIQLHKSKWWRFDTSPHGDGGRGPRLRYLPRFTSGFVARHAEGL